MVRKIVLGLIVVFVGMQFIRPPKNLTAKESGTNDLFACFGAPAKVRRVMEAACYDCHSNHTRYPWYAEIQPGGWLLAKHVRDGKRLVNFSEFGQLSPTRAKRQLALCVDQINEREMPLGSYTLIHREARLTDEQVAILVGWLEETAERVATLGIAHKAPEGSTTTNID